ncbi:MAG: N-6 DNA methylase, partial [Vicinamibacterales bacterium]
RTLHLRYDQYEARWDEISELFSREAVLAGAIEARFPKDKVPRGTATVDRAFLAEIEGWREALARNIALRNPGLTGRELNIAVQLTVDRIIFLRMAEDRGIEEYGRLEGLTKGDDVYARLRDLYRQADERYNSGLFHFTEERGRPEAPDTLTPRLAIDDRVPKSIFRNLYYPKSPYEFSVLPVDVLGQVYEQFLGKVITIPRPGRVTIEEKPEVRKAGGVYYTPTYIVDYIVAQTVGRLLEGKTPRQARNLAIVDPACGSGTFLLGAYTYLLKWYREWYVADGPEKHGKELIEARREEFANEWWLTTAERKRILTEHIYGVDIDPQAVEVTKLSLLLKLLEGETSSSVGRQLQFAYRERVLPDMGANIK